MKALSFFVILVLPTWLYSQQIADTSFNPIIQNPMYETGKGSVVFVDEGHHNFHTKNGRYKAFSNLLERDGYIVKAYKDVFRINELGKGKILVISNALNEINVDDWYVPNPSAFSEAEIRTLKKWVRKGGSLFLIADHMPMAGAAQDLAAEFEFEFTNGFVFDTVSKGPSIIFNTKESTLFVSSITQGRDANERVNQIVSFTGQGFQIPDDATPILIFDENCVNILPDTAWVFEKETPKLSAKGRYQGAYKKYRKGKIVVFGEAAMFTAQLAGRDKIKMGMNNEAAPENFQLALNIIHWLDGKLE